jgi:hypothetical protein
MIGVHWWSEEIEYPAQKEPEWSAQVERWYQLDTPAYILTETYWRLRDKLPPQSPEWLLLASPGASNLTDAQFASTSAASPAKFVHTLPNIRSASLLQVMHWSGKVLCLQNDPSTIVAALTEASDLASEGPIWLACVTSSGSRHTGHLVTVRVGDDGAPLILTKNRADAGFTDVAHDRDLLHWITNLVTSARCFSAGKFTLCR